MRTASLLTLVPPANNVPTVDVAKPTLQQVWLEFQQTGRLKESTRRGYQNALNARLSDWLGRPITEITKNDVEARHRLISQKAPYVADQTMRILKSLITYGIHKYDLDIINPTRRLSDCRLWHRARRRTSYIEPHQMRVWFDAVMESETDIYRNFLIFLLLTGCRKAEAAKLQWKDVDLEGATVTFHDTKNGDSVKLPISSFLCALLVHSRHSTKSKYVFPGESVHGHIGVDNNFYLRTAKLAGIHFTPHDARRSFSCVADSLELPLHTIKRLLNHRTNDVTVGYIIHNVERLRKPVEQITHEILRLAGREQLSLISEVMKPRASVLRGSLEIEILTHMNLSLKNQFTVRDIWMEILKRRSITYDTIRITLKKLATNKHVRQVSQVPLCVYALPTRAIGPTRARSRRTEHSIKAEAFWRQAIAEQVASKLMPKEYCRQAKLSIQDFYYWRKRMCPTTEC
jgi:integrase